MRSGVLWQVLGALAIGALAFLLTFTLPKFIDLYKQRGVVDFPLPTRLAMHLTYFLTAKWWRVVLGVVLACWGLERLAQTETGARYLSRFQGRGGLVAIVTLGIAMGLVMVSMLLPLIAAVGSLNSS